MEREPINSIGIQRLPQYRERLSICKGQRVLGQRLELFGFVGSERYYLLLRDYRGGRFEQGKHIFQRGVRDRSLIYPISNMNLRDGVGDATAQNSRDDGEQGLHPAFDVLIHVTVEKPNA